MRAALIAGALVLCLAVPVSAADQVPIKGSFVGSASVTPLDPPIVSVLVVATGHASQLGHFTLEAPHLVNQATLTASGTYVLTAANGDTLSASFVGTASPIDPPFIIGISETATVTGGTGRFVGATGTFSVHRVFNRATGVTTGSFEGRISTPGS